MATMCKFAAPNDAPTLLKGWYGRQTTFVRFSRSLIFLISPHPVPPPTNRNLIFAPSFVPPLSPISHLLSPSEAALNFLAASIMVSNG